MSEDYPGNAPISWPARSGMRPDDYAEPALTPANVDATVRLIHPSVISSARAELGRGQYREVHDRLGQDAPDVLDLDTLHIAQRWHGVKADAYLMQGRPEAAVTHSLAGLELGIEHGGEDPDQPIYTATLFCTYAEASRRAGRIDDETLEGLREFVRSAGGNPNESIIALVKYAQRTLELAGKRRKRGVIKPPLSTQFTLPF